MTLAEGWTTVKTYYRRVDGAVVRFSLITVPSGWVAMTPDGGYLVGDDGVTRWADPYEAMDLLDERCKIRRT